MTSEQATPHPRPKPQPRRRSRRTIWLIVGAIVLAAILGIALWIALQPATPSAPAQGTVVVVADETRAATAAREDSGQAGRAAEYLADQPTAVWLTPEADPGTEATERVEDLARLARRQDAALAIVVYGIPGRDCGGLSAGGTEADEYGEWIDAIAEGLESAEGITKIVVLEPDSLALAVDCGDAPEKTELLRDAVTRLQGPDVWIYVDGGHSNWLPADQMAALIAGVANGGGVRGFATNVSNYNATDAEIDYAHRVSELTGGLHAIIDTSRNGAGSDGEWCNPSGRLIGQPGGSIGDDVVDTNLWVKAPGESDGTCNGGPIAGEWWSQSAIELTRRVVD